MATNRIPEAAGRAGLPALILLLAMTPAASAQTVDPEWEEAARQVFETSESRLARQSAALQLWLGGIREPAYFDFLLELGQAAVEPAPPFPLATGADGRLVRGELSEDFQAWATAGRKQLEVELARELRERPLDVVLLGSTLDPRAIPVLQQGLTSANPMVVVAAAEGLARVENEAALPRLLELARDGAPDMAQSIALELLYFEDPEAQALAETVLADPELVAAVRAAAAEWREARERILESAALDP